MSLRSTIPATTLLMTMISTAATPPVAKKVPHTEQRHGATITDNYFWLRQKTSPEVTAYLEAENAYTEEMTKDLKPMQEKLYQEMLGRIKQTDLSVPTKRGDYFYYSRTEEGKQYPIQCRKKGSMETGTEEVLIDLNVLGAGKKFISLGGFQVSDNQNLLAYSTDYVGFRQYTLHVKDLRTGQELMDSAERVTSFQWAADNQTIFYVTEDATTKRSDRLWRLSLGNTEKKEMFFEKDELFDVRLGKTLDKNYLILHSNSTDTSESQFLRSDQPHLHFTLFLQRQKGHRYDIDHREGQFYIRSNKNAKNFQMLTAPVSDYTPANWKVFIPHKDNALLRGMDLFAGFGVAVSQSEALTKLDVIDFRTNEWKSIAFSEPVYAANPGGTVDYYSTTYRYSYQSMVTPPTVYDYDTKTATSIVLKRQEVLGGYDPANYVSERLWATARDGVKIPLSIVYKKGFKRDGKAPLFLYAYGSYGIGMQASFNSQRLSLLDRGIPYVIAHIRGGNEMGEKWHEDGMLMKKKNTFYDFIDTAEWLIKEKWTNKGGLMIEGGSAGGLLMGAVVNYRPDLFRAVHSAVPFVDVMNTMMDATLPLTVGEYLEWGNPNEKPAYDYMKSYSPYDNLEKRAYPAILVTTSFHDSQVSYWEPAKYVALLRTLKADKNELLLKTRMQPAGHGGASGRYDRLRDTAFEYAWMLKQVGITQ